MSKAFQDLLIGRKIFEGRVVALDFECESPRAILVDDYMCNQRFGELFVARLAGTSSTPFMLKIPSQPLLENHGYLENEIEKLKALAPLNNPHVPQIYSHFLLGGGKKLPYYLTHYFNISTERFPEIKLQKPGNHYDALLTFYHLVHVLETLERQNLVHGDIHPETIQFLGKMPVIAHWGTAKTTQEISKITEHQGRAALYVDPRWLAPEVFSMEQLPDGSYNIGVHYEMISPKADVWDLGLVFMYYLTGRNFFDTLPTDGNIENDLQFMLEHSHGQLLAHYKAQAKQILEKHYLSPSYLQQKKFVNDIYKLCWTQEAKDDLSTLDKKFILRFGLDHLVATRDKLMAAGEEKEQVIKQFYIDLLFNIFDVCIAPIKSRTSAGQLLKLLNILFPNLASEAKTLMTSHSLPTFLHKPLTSSGRMMATRFKNQMPIANYITCHPFPPFKLEKGTDFTIGREVANQLVLASTDVSRYHAVIKWEKNAFVISDLGSANKTHVNDEKISSKSLKNGDKLRIGRNTVLLYQEVDVGHAPALGSAQSTEVLDTSSQDIQKYIQNMQKFRSSLQGDIETMGLFSVLQMLGSDNKSGCLKVTKDGELASIYFLNGVVIHCARGELKGRDAFWHIARWKKGTFEFDTSEGIEEVTMSNSVESLLLEVACFIDEARQED